MALKAIPTDEVWQQYRHALHLPTRPTTLGHVLKTRINPGPPYIATYYCLHLGNALMFTVEYTLTPQSILYHYPDAPHQTASCGLTTSPPLESLVSLRHIKQFPSMESSSLWFRKGLRASYTCLGHPILHNYHTLLNRGSVEVTSNESLLATLKTSAPIILESTVGSVRRDRPWSSVRLNSMSYWYATRTNVQRCNQAATKGGVPFFGFRIVIRGLCSLSS